MLCKAWPLNLNHKIGDIFNYKKKLIKVSVWREFSTKEHIKHNHRTHNDQAVTLEARTNRNTPTLLTVPSNILYGSQLHIGQAYKCVYETNHKKLAAVKIF